MTHFKDILDSKKINAGEAAKICGVTERTIYYWINGKIIPKKAYIHIIENYKP